MSGNRMQIFLILALLVSIVSGCNDLKPFQTSKESRESTKEPYVEPAAGNARKVLSMAFDVAKGIVPSDDLVSEFKKLSTTQIKQLARKKMGEVNFLWCLSAGIISPEIVTMAEKFLTTLPKTLVSAQLGAKFEGKTPVEMLRGVRPVQEQCEDRNKVLALFLIAEPGLVNGLQDAERVFNAEEFTTLMSQIDETKISGVAEVLDSDHIKAWLHWATSDEDPEQRRQRLLANFKKIYVRAGPYKQPDMRNFLLEKAYADDCALIAQGEPATKLLALIEELPILGLDQNIGADTYQLTRYPRGSGKHVGSFLYVLTKRISEDVLRRAGLNWENLRSTSHVLKEILKTTYEHHVQDTLFGSLRESILVSLERAGLSTQAAKLTLHLSIQPQDIYEELKRLSTKAHVAERNVSSDLKILLEDYQREHETLDEIAQLVVPQTDNALGNLRAGDLFLHVLSELKTDALALEIFQFFTQHVSDRSTIIGQDSARARSAISLLTDTHRSNLLVGDEHEALIKHLLVETLHHGDKEALEKCFHDINDTSLAILGSFAYEHRNEILRGSTDSMAVLCATEYGNRGAHGKTLARSLIEAALKDAALGNGHSGMIALIGQGFLPAQALLDRGYELFDAHRHSGANNTLLYDVLLYSAAKKLVHAVAQSYPNNQAYANRWTESYKALNSKIRGRGENRIILAIGNLWVANAAMAAFEGALLEEEIRALAQAYKSKLPAADWLNLAQNNTNSSSHNRMVWELLQFTVAGRAITDEASARTPTFLDY